MNWWETILTAIGGSGFFSWYFQRRIDHSLNEKLESFRTELRLAEFRLTKLHEKRADVIENIYRRLVDADNIADKFVSSCTAVAPQELRKPAKEAKVAIDDFYDYFDHRRIYLNEELCQSIIDYHSHVLSPVASVEAQVVFTDANAGQMLAAKEKSLKDLMTKAHPVRSQLEREFRLLLGVIKEAPQGSRSDG